MNIFHIGDCHIGKRQYGLKQREKDIEDAVDFAVDHVINSGGRYQVFIWPGDVFDAVRPRPESVLFLKKMVSRLSAAGVRSLGIDGNHDAVDCAWLSLAGVETFSPGEVKEINGVKFAGLNYTPATKLNEAVEAMAGLKFDVLIMHQALAEAANFAGIGGGIMVTADWITSTLSETGLKYLAMGDIHKKFEQDINGVRVVYPGSVELLSVSEDWEKYGVSVNLEGATPSTQWVPIKTRPVKTVKVTEDKDIENLAVEVSGDLESLYFVQVSRSMPDGVSRCRQVLKDSLYRVTSVTFGEEETTALDVAHWERGNAVVDVAKAVEDSFGPDSDEYGLILSCIAKPGGLQDIVETYMKDHKVSA